MLFVAGFHAAIQVGNDTVALDEDDLAARARPELVQRAVGPGHLLVRVGHQWKGQPFPKAGCEALLSVEIVGADSDHFGFRALEPRVELLQSAELMSSPAREGLWKECEDDFLALKELRERERIADRGLSRKFGGAVAPLAVPGQGGAPFVRNPPR